MTQEDILEIKNFFQRPISEFNPKLAFFCSKLGLNTALDLLLHLPSGIIHKNKANSICELRIGMVNTVCINVDESLNKSKKHAPIRLKCSDDNGDNLSLIFFNARDGYLEKKFPVGSKCVVSGFVESYKNRLQIVHPDRVAPEFLFEELCKSEIIYPLTAGLTNYVLRTAILQNLNKLKHLWHIDDWVEQDFLDKYQLSNWYESLVMAHNPESTSDLDPLISKYKLRLALDELAFRERKVSKIIHQRLITDGIKVEPSENLRKIFFDLNPNLELTEGQKKALSDADNDLLANYPMLRLIQGDVGCGKTLVSFLLTLSMVEAGYQCVFLAPTEVLAKQHYDTIVKFCGFGSIKIDILTSSSKNKPHIYSNIKNGITNITIGTHALFEDVVDFCKLGLIIIDEQHRFGVQQRERLVKKNPRANTLYLSATPIPRTVLMVYDGSIDISEIYDKPKNRLDVTTTVLSCNKINELMLRIKNLLESGQQVYWVCPLVEESEKLDLSAAKSRFEFIESYFPQFKIGLVHGKQKDKDVVMNSFKNGKINLLVSTTVIEVGVDVANATLIVIEHAERFGLAQLHQLRGRVGRGEIKSHCVLLYQPPLTKIARQRLKIIQDSCDGFEISRQDLNIRHGGDVLGIKQSGLPDFKTCSIHDAFILIDRVKELSAKSKDFGIFN